MQSVDILGNCTQHPAFAFEPGNEPVGKGWFNIFQHPYEILAEPIEQLRVIPKITDIEYPVSIVLLRRIETAGSSKIRNSGCRGNTGTGEYGDLTGIHQLLRALPGRQALMFRTQQETLLAF